MVPSSPLPHPPSPPCGPHLQTENPCLVPSLCPGPVLCSTLLATSGLDLDHLLQVRQLCVVRTQNERVSRDYYQLLGQLQDMTAVGQPVTGALPPILESGGVEDSTEQVSGCQQGLVTVAVLDCHPAA